MFDNKRMRGGWWLVLAVLMGLTPAAWAKKPADTSETPAASESTTDAGSTDASAGTDAATDSSSSSTSADNAGNSDASSTNNEGTSSAASDVDSTSDAASDGSAAAESSDASSDADADGTASGDEATAADSDAASSGDTSNNNEGNAASADSSSETASSTGDASGSDTSSTDASAASTPTLTLQASANGAAKTTYFTHEDVTFTIVPNEALLSLGMDVKMKLLLRIDSNKADALKAAWVAGAQPVLPQGMSLVSADTLTFSALVSANASGTYTYTVPLSSDLSLALLPSSWTSLYVKAIPVVDTVETSAYVTAEQALAFTTTQEASPLRVQVAFDADSYTASLKSKDTMTMSVALSGNDEALAGAGLCTITIGLTTPSGAVWYIPSLNPPHTAIDEKEMPLNDGLMELYAIPAESTALKLVLDRDLFMAGEYEGFIRVENAAGEIVAQATAQMTVGLTGVSADGSSSSGTSTGTDGSADGSASTDSLNADGTAKTTGDAGTSGDAGTTEQPETTLLPETHIAAIATLPKNVKGLEMKLLSIGAFEMGASAEVRGVLERDAPKRLVSMTKEFYIGVYEITQAQYAQFDAEHASTFNGKDRPVEEISWNEAAAFVAWLNETDSTRPEGWAYRLPTEAEWEYACRAGTNTEFALAQKNTTAKDAGWVKDNANGITQKVGKKTANAWGLYDMHGNVAEWCLDWYDADFYSRARGDDPVNLTPALTRVVRGGSWMLGEEYARSANRQRGNPGLAKKSGSIGFRVVLAPKSEQ